MLTHVILGMMEYAIFLITVSGLVARNLKNGQGASVYTPLAFTAMAGLVIVRSVFSHPLVMLGIVAFFGVLLALHHISQSRRFTVWLGHHER
jgi:hypothetical protein